VTGADSFLAILGDFSGHLMPNPRKAGLFQPKSESSFAMKVLIQKA